ncbi:unnamed protein product [Enterobius vermicularis]|uniref:Porin n=1 Tax=Enterobius vermicularis TaxID=51028 RepID=A0A0N4UTU9_ENTVE|nr:unnamed protein product [Enterobius vermicularis]
MRYESGSAISSATIAEVPPKEQWVSFGPNALVGLSIGREIGVRNKGDVALQAHTLNRDSSETVG